MLSCANECASAAAEVEKICGRVVLATHGQGNAMRGAQRRVCIWFQPARTASHSRG